MTSEQKRKSRLIWALRYIMTHPDLSPSVMSEVWEIPIEEAIDICSRTFATAYVTLGIRSEDFEKFEKMVFEKLMECK